jgi:hypothetical protein
VACPVAKSSAVVFLLGLGFFQPLEITQVCFVGALVPEVKVFLKSFVHLSFSQAEGHRPLVQIARRHWQYGRSFAEAHAVYQALKAQTCRVVIVSNLSPSAGYLAQHAKRSRLVHFTEKMFVVLPGKRAYRKTVPGTEKAGSEFLRSEGLALADSVWDSSSTLPASKPRIVEEALKPLVSVVIVTYERPALLRECLSSVRSQTYSHIEVVIVDDGSPSRGAKDGLDELEAEFAEFRWKVVRQKNSFLGAARNAGVRESSGRAVLFLDDDNIALPDMGTMLAAAISTCEVAVGGHWVWWPKEDRAKVLWLPLGPLPHGGARNRSFVGSANFMIRRETFDRLGGFSTERSGWEDFEFHSRAVEEGVSYCIVPEPLMLYRMHSSSQMSLTADNSKNAAKVAQLYAARYAQQGP